MQSIIRRFLSFDQLIGPVLVKLIYWVAAAGIALAIGGVILSGIASIAAGNIGGGAMQIIAGPAVGLVVLVYWRFLCELFMVAFLSYERLGEIRDLATGSTHDPDYPQF